MSENVVQLQTVCTAALPVDGQVVAMLETLLAAAKVGEFNGLAFATVQIDGAGSVVSCGQGYTGQGIYQSVHASIGAVEVLRHRLITERVEF